MRTFLIFFFASILLTLTDAQRKPNITKPIVNLQKVPRPVWHRPPEERRKLSIFPRNNMKFVVTPKTVKYDHEAADGLPTKRPVMRKFVMHDKNEKGTWSFAPREPLMKTQRFTVTSAPTKSSHHSLIDEMKPEESKKVQTVISNLKSEQKSSKVHNINKGNLIETVKMKNELSISKHLHKIERNITIENISETMINDTRNPQLIQRTDTDNKILPTFGESLIDVRGFNDDGVILDDNITTNHDQDVHKTVKKTTESLNIKKSEDLIESRGLDLNQMTYSINQNENNSLIMDSEGSNDGKIGQVLHINDHEILLEKDVNNTEQSNNNSTLELNKKGTSLLFTSNNQSSITIKNVPQVDVTKPNTFYDVTSLSNEDKENTNMEEHFSAVSFILNTTNDKTHSVRETNALNDKDNSTYHVADPIVTGNLDSLINFIENNTDGTTKTVKLKSQTENVGNKEKFNINNGLIEYTTFQSIVDEITSQYTVNETEVEHQTQSPEKINKTDSNGPDSHDLSLEIYESNMSLSSEEISTECDEYDADECTSGNLNVTMEETSNEDLIDNLNSSSLEEISNTSISDTSNYYAEERSNESLIDYSNNLTNEQISNESYLNIAGEDKSNNLTEEISESSNNNTGEQFSNESSSNMAAEDQSNESYYVDNSNNLTGGISSASITDSSNNFNERISNELSSAIAAEETSNESYLSDDTSIENIEDSNNFTEELISNESSLNVSDDNSKETIESSNQFSGENTSNVSFNISGEEIANGFSLEGTVTFSNFTREDLIDNIDVRMSEGPADSLHDGSAEKIADEALTNRFKRSNNVIEEEISPTSQWIQIHGSPS